MPSGAKGGFVCKRLPDPADRDAYQAEVLACYQMFISAMLDITDNIAGDAGGAAARRGPPRRRRPLPGGGRRQGHRDVLRRRQRDRDRYGFWLGDAFASGGSEGYDHKKMGITARGAWESVRWHFAALRLNPDTDDFTAVGVGDMSGDVFGNGMLLSRHIKLVAAFDHRHVFLDPDPDPAASFAERQRLFDAAQLVLGRLRPRADLGGRRRVAPRRRSRCRSPRRPAPPSASTTGIARRCRRTS